MTPFAAKLIWISGVISWFIIRYPHQRRSKKTPRALQITRARELTLMIISASGLGVIPAIWVWNGMPAWAEIVFEPWRAVVGSFVFLASLWLFRRTHKDLGRNWSVTLEVRKHHELVTWGVYRWVRHPMYTAFWLWALAQALLLPNLFAGLAGLIGFGTLFFFRVPTEERMMIDAFGEEYRTYRAGTWRVFPGFY